MPVEKCSRHLERRQLLNFAITSASLGAHFVSLLIATMSQEEGKANWNDAETLALVNFLWKHRAEAGDGGTFKNTTFNAAAADIAKLWSTGAAKNGARCKTKWAGVSPSDAVLPRTDSSFQLKTIFRGIVAYKEKTSGTHWDNNNGAGIDGEAALLAWNNYISASKVS
jgi:hypothetical protein